MSTVISCVYVVPLAGSPRFPGEPVEKGLQGEAGTARWEAGFVGSQTALGGGWFLVIAKSRESLLTDSWANCQSISRRLIGRVQHTCVQPWLPTWGTNNEITRQDLALIAKPPFPLGV